MLPRSKQTRHSLDAAYPQTRTEKSPPHPHTHDMFKGSLVILYLTLKEISQVKSDIAKDL